MRTAPKPPNDVPRARARRSGRDGKTWSPPAVGIAGLVHDADAEAGGRTGRVTLIGAGPGDAELLTLKAVRALQAADVVLIDALVEDAVLAFVRPDAARVTVGKRSGQASCRQEDINDLMVALARAGKHVVRLKSGDPTIFGRAGEELARLGEAGIPVEIVPGITAASAMAAAVGFSLTHRDHAQSVRFITGHSHRGGLPEDVDWQQVADPRTTTVFYMGGRLAPDIARRLIGEGLAAETPALAIASISRTEEQVWRGDLKTLADRGHGLPVGAPTLLAVGGAVVAPAATDAELPASGQLMSSAPMENALL